MNSIKKWLSRTSTAGLEMLFPGVCALCGSAHQQSIALCLACEGALPRNLRACKQCGLALPSSTEQCGRCQRKALVLQEIHAPFLYQHPMDALILRFKRGSDLACGKLLAELFCQQFQPTDRPELLIPVPLHKNRLRERGFDQAAQLSRHFGAHYGIASLDCLVRSRDTGSQAGLSAVQRKINVRGAFKASSKISANHVVLVDDVATTCATLNACALTLKRAGVARVDAWVLARA